MCMGMAFLGSSCGDLKALRGLRRLYFDISGPKFYVSKKELGFVPIIKGKSL